MKHDDFTEAELSYKKICALCKTPLKISYLSGNPKEADGKVFQCPNCGLTERMCFSCGFYTLQFNGKVYVCRNCEKQCSRNFLMNLEKEFQVTLTGREILAIIDQNNGDLVFNRYNDTNAVRESIRKKMYDIREAYMNKPTPILKGKSAKKFYDSIQNGKTLPKQQAFLEQCSKLAHDTRGPFSYNIGYHTHESTVETILQHTNHYTNVELRSLIEQAIETVVAKLIRDNLYVGGYEALHYEVIDHLIQDFGFTKPKLQATWNCFGWSHVLTEEDWTDEINANNVHLTKYLNKKGLLR
jgi:hypothetical protein